MNITRKIALLYTNSSAVLLNLIYIGRLRAKSCKYELTIYTKDLGLD